MIRTMYSAAGKLQVALFTAVALALASTGMAQDAASAATPAASAAPAGEELQELDEIMVRGGRLLDLIAEKEDKFYDLFNKLNDDDRYDTACVYLNLDPESLTAAIKSRVCIPGFVADAMADYAVWKSFCRPPTDGFDEYDCLDKNDDNRLSMNEAMARPELVGDFATLDADMDGILSREEFGTQTMGSTIAYQPPPPQLVLMEGTKKWYDHMMKVTNSDPRLADMAGELDDLYRELVTVQNRYAELQPDEAPDPANARRASGPRGR